LDLALTADSDNNDEQWCAGHRLNVIEYLQRQNVQHSQIGLWPAWHIVPYVSVWAVESIKSPGWVGWWVICGDLPTDYMTSGNVRHPRDAVRKFAELWLEAVPYMLRGENHPNISFGSGKHLPTLALLLKSRAELLLAWVADETIWQDDE
jgi:hypothetical protein